MNSENKVCNFFYARDFTSFYINEKVLVEKIWLNIQDVGHEGTDIKI